MFAIFNNSFRAGIDQSERMLVAIALDQGPGGPPDVTDATLLGAGSCEARVSLRGTTRVDEMVVEGGQGLEAVATYLQIQ